MDVTQFGGDAGNRRRLFDSSIRAFDAVGTCARPVIAAVNGPAIAGGFALALLCDLRVAAREATFGFPELPRGIPPSYAAARATLTASVARDLCLTGRLVDAVEAHRLGIVHELASGDCVERGLELAEAMVGRPLEAALATKRRVLLERERTWGYLFEEERRALWHALLGEEPEPAA
jgi:enoyl-CoA hydratase